MALRHREVTGQILHAYYEVWNHTARTYPEFIYERCMQLELEPHLECTRQERYDIFYKNIKVGQQELDLFLADEIVVELKAAQALTRLHKAQTISYIKVVGKQDGLLLNFGGPKPEFHRLFYNPPAQPMAQDTIRKVDEEGAPYAPDLVYTLRGALFEVFAHLGPGFVHRIYANACYRELKERGLPAQAHAELEVSYKGQPISTIKFAHLQVEDILLFPVAHTNPDALPIQAVKSYLTYHQLPLAIVANFQTLTLAPIIVRPNP